MDVGLKGIRIIETASVVGGPMAGRLLADWGADVIHVDYVTRKAIEDQRKTVGAITSKTTGVVTPTGDYRQHNTHRNKRNVELDLSKEQGREIIYRMLKKADVLLANFRPRELEKFKLEYETLSQLNPRLICANITGYGRKGPDGDAPAYGQLAGDARGGLLHSLQFVGSPPPQTSGTMTDFMTSLALACGITTALFIRERTGVGQEVDVSLFNTMVFALSGDIATTIVTKQTRQTLDRNKRGSAVGNSYQTKDGRWLLIGLGPQADLYWARLCRSIEREDLENDSRFASTVARAENYAALLDILDEVFLSKTLDEWKAHLSEGGLPWAPVQDYSEVLKDLQARANGFFIPFDDPTYGQVDLIANPIKLSKTPEIVRMGAPMFGQHTDEILREHGYTSEDIAQFTEQGVIG